MDCLTNLVGLKELCSDNAIQPLFWLDDAEGIDRNALAELAKSSVGSGKQFGLQIIESEARFMVSDIETLIPKGYTIKSALNSFCNTCTYTSLSSSSNKTGIVVKNISTSKNTYLSIDSLKVMLQTDGLLTIVLDDGIAPKQIPYTFTAGVEVVITNINFKTSATSINIYIMEDGADVAALNCPTTKSCGCSGATKQSKDISVKGLLGGSEFTTQYGFIPCASVICSMDNILCQIINQQPRLFGATLFYRSVARIFREPAVTERNNAFASFDKEAKKEVSDFNMSLYYERLNGSDKVKGIADNLAAALNNLKDECVECSRITSTSWATG